MSCQIECNKLNNLCLAKLDTPKSTPSEID